MLTWWQIIVIVFGLSAVKWVGRWLLFKQFPSLLLNSISNVKEGLKENVKETG